MADLTKLTAKKLCARMWLNELPPGTEQYEIRRRLERLKQCEAALRMILELIEQYTRLDFYMWLMNDPHGLQSDPTKKAIEAKDAARVALEQK